MVSDGHADNNLFLNQLREAISEMQSQIIKSTNIYIDDNDPLMVVIACCQLMISEFEVLMTRSLRMTEESVKADVEALKTTNAENLKKLNQLIGKDFTQALDSNTQDFVQTMIAKIIDALENSKTPSTSDACQNQESTEADNKRFSSIESTLKLACYGVFANLGLASAIVIYLLISK